MLTKMEYIKMSVETNLFFLRIMKEHFVFAASALMLKDAGMAPGLMQTKEMFEMLLDETVVLARRVVTPQTMEAGDIVTEFTYKAELAAVQYTGLPINTSITLREMRLLNNSGTVQQIAEEQAIDSLNRRTITLLESAIGTQRETLQKVLNCRMYAHAYPLMLDHATREAEHYLMHLQALQRRENIEDEATETAAHEVFWNDIMGEHAKFLRGLMDPAEDELIRIANGFSEEFDELTAAAKEAYDILKQLPPVTGKILSAVTDIRNFKEQVTEGILECNIRAMILPLLGDHILREANHYIRHLRMYI